MIHRYREDFNRQFSDERYAAIKNSIADDFGYMTPFRIAESPFFIPDSLKAQILEGCEQVIDFIKRADFKQLTEKALEAGEIVPGEDDHPTFLAVDFGICEEDGEVVPKLIEVQGFPSLFNYQPELYNKFRDAYPFLDGLTPYFDGLDERSYLDKLRRVILNGHSPEQVVLLEIEPTRQNTRIDFDYCHRHLGVSVLCVTDIIKKGKKLFYIDRHGKETQIRRIYNRVIFDELLQRPDLKMDFAFTDELDVEWAGHPNWFYRISKYILPMLHGKYFIESTLLSDLTTIPADLENYVLKPLFSFSGSGVIFHVTTEDILAVTDRSQYMLQKKVSYLPVLQSPDGKVKVEVRILYIWEKNADRPTAVCNLARLSRGEMIGVKFNKDKDWVGGSIALFERGSQS